MPDTASDLGRTPAPLVVVSDVRVSFGGLVALDSVSFDVHAGQITGLIGPNGAGKTTLFNCLTRLYDCERGSIVFDRTDLTRLPSHRVVQLGIARTFQNVALFGSMSVLDNVMVGRHCRTRSGFLASALGLPRVSREEHETREHVRELVRWLGLDGMAGVLVAQLPFALQKRVELARALASRPKLLLLDEPASGLDHEEVSALRSLIRELRDRLCLTVMLVEHHMSLVMGVSDKVVALNFGRKIAEGSPGEVQAHPDVVQAYLGSAA